MKVFCLFSFIDKFGSGVSVCQKLCEEVTAILCRNYVELDADVYESVHRDMIMKVTNKMHYTG